MTSFSPFKRLVRFLLTVSLVFISAGFAQQNITISGVIQSDGEMLPNTRLGLHLLDTINRRFLELGNVPPVGGTFTLGTNNLDSSMLQPLRNGGTVLPGIQNEFTVSPEGVNYARAVTNVYADANNNSVFDDPNTDPLYLGIASVDNPKGFFILMYVDRDAQLVARAATLNLKHGWNIITLRSDSTGALTSYNVQQSLSDAVLDVFVPR